VMYVFIGERQSKEGPESDNTGPIGAEHIIVRFTKRALTLLMSAALVLADIPGFGLQSDASMTPETSKGSQIQNTKEIA
jgi:hypothetical protein